MGADLAGKRVLVLSDNDGLSRAIKLNLERSDLEVVKLALNSPGQQRPELRPEPNRRAVEGRCPEPVKGRGNQAEMGDFDLIVVAMSSSTSEPIVALARASLAGRIGQVPLLIISDRPFHSEPDDQIAHLDFPFDIDGLYDKVKDILQRGSEPTRMRTRKRGLLAG
jgi:hypothetical protein